MVFTCEADNVSCHNSATQKENKPKLITKNQNPNNTNTEQNPSMIGLIKNCGHF